MAIDESFYVPRVPVSVVAVGDAGEASLIRAILENLGTVVTLHLPGTPEDFLKLLSQGAGAPQTMILSGHGDESDGADAGFLFGDYAPEIDVSMLQDGRLSAEAVAARADLPGTLIISTACATGSKAFGRVFVEAGARAYIGPDGYPDGAEAALFVHKLMHGLLHRELPLQKAFDEAQAADAVEDRFVLYPGESSAD